MGRAFPLEGLAETASRNFASERDAVSGCVPQRKGRPGLTRDWDTVSGTSLQGKVRPIPRPQTGTQPPPTAFPADVSPDKTCQNKPVPFWQVLEANGEGDLVAVAADRSAPAMGFGDGTHHG